MTIFDGDWKIVDILLFQSPNSKKALYFFQKLFIGNDIYCRIICRECYLLFLNLEESIFKKYSNKSVSLFPFF